MVVFSSELQTDFDLFQALTFTTIALTPKLMVLQKAWLEAIENRMAVTVAMISSMKGIKMLGLSRLTKAHLQQSREDEVRIGK